MPGKKNKVGGVNALRLKNLTKNNKKNKNTNRIRTLSTPPRLPQYAAALLHPFSSVSDGVRVPEPYALKTTTHKSRTTFIVTTSSGGGFDMVVNQHPMVCTVTNTLGSITGGLTYSAANQPSGVFHKRIITPADMAAVCTSYRIVAAGVRVKALVNFNNSQGRVYGAIIPASYELPVNYASNSMTVPMVWDCLGVPYDGSNNVSTQLGSLPSGFQFQISELMAENGVEITFPIVGPGALNFLDSQLVQNEQSMISAVSAIPLGYASAVGKSQLLIRGEGMALTTDCLSVEVIFHVEAMPRVGTVVPSGNVASVPASPQVVHSAHAMASSIPAVRYISHKMEEAEKLFPSNSLLAKASKAVTKYGGTAERILGVGMSALSLFG